MNLDSLSSARCRARSALIVSILAVSVGLAVASAVTAAADPVQSGRNLEQPPNWHVRFDHGAGERAHVVMRPGWHVHPGPAGIFWDPGSAAAGNYAISSTIFLFPAGSGDPPSTTDAPYGILFAGEALDSMTPSYATFLIRNDGSFQIARHSAAGSEEIVAWTPHEAIATWSPGDDGTAENVLGVDFADENVTFWVNDVQLSLLPRGDVSAGGIIGLRAGAGLSLHVSDLAIGPNRR